jgi:hypothetical protein
VGPQQTLGQITLGKLGTARDGTGYPLQRYFTRYEYAAVLYRKMETLENTYFTDNK